MSQNLPDWFIPKYTEEVLLRAQQTKAALADNVSNGGIFTGDTLYMPRMGQVEAMSVARLQALATTAPPLDWISLQCKPLFLPIVLWDPDMNKLNIKVAQEFARAVTAGIVRARDSNVATAIKTAITNGVTGVRGPSAEATPAPATENITTIGDYNTVADLDAIAEGIAQLGTNYSLEGEQIVYCSPFKIKTNMSLDPYMAKSDMKNNLPWNDVTFTSYEKMPGNGAAGDGDPTATGVDTWLFAKSAVTEAFNDEVKDINERLGNIMANMFGQWFQGGAAVREPKGIIRIKSKYDFHLSRKAIPVIGVT